VAVAGEDRAFSRTRQGFEEGHPMVRQRVFVGLGAAVILVGLAPEEAAELPQAD
jgi:hypothetical protein